MSIIQLRYPARCGECNRDMKLGWKANYDAGVVYCTHCRPAQAAQDNHPTSDSPTPSRADIPTTPRPPQPTPFSPTTQPRATPMQGILVNPQDMEVFARSVMVMLDLVKSVERLAQACQQICSSLGALEKERSTQNDKNAVSPKPSAKDRTAERAVESRNPLSEDCDIPA